MASAVLLVTRSLVAYMFPIMCLGAVFHYSTCSGRPLCNQHAGASTAARVVANTGSLFCGLLVLSRSLQDMERKTLILPQALSHSTFLLQRTMSCVAILLDFDPEPLQVPASLAQMQAGHLGPMSPAMALSRMIRSFPRQKCPLQARGCNLTCLEPRPLTQIVTGVAK